MSVTLNPQLATSLSDARRQLHHAAQLATAAGISYLPARPDDSHTNLEWLAGDGMLASNPVPLGGGFRVAVRAADLTLAVLDANGATRASFPLHGHSLDEAAAWLRDRVTEAGADPSRFTLARHYEIPHHPVADGAAFDTSNAAAFEQLSGWFDVGADVLEELRRSTPNVSPVRCWPHHFDIAVLINIAPGQTIGVGLEPGDVYYDEPYVYVNVSPQPTTAPTVALAAGGSWHSHEWIGAALPVSRLSGGDPRPSIRAFIQSAVPVLRSTLSAPR